MGNSFKELGTTFGAAFGAEGLQSLFSDSSKIPQVLMTIIAFSLSDTFDTIGTFIGTGRRTGIFSKEDELALEDSKGFSTKMDKALFADAIATSIGAIFGTSNTTTYVESAAGIGAGGRTGLTSVVVAILFALSSLFTTYCYCASTSYGSSVNFSGNYDVSFFQRHQLDGFRRCDSAFCFNFHGIML